MVPIRREGLISFPSAKFDNGIDGRHYNRNEFIKQQRRYLVNRSLSLAGEGNCLDRIKTDPGIVVPQGTEKFRGAATCLSKPNHRGLAYICINVPQKPGQPRCGLFGGDMAKAVYSGNLYFFLRVFRQSFEYSFIRYRFGYNLADLGAVSRNAGKKSLSIYLDQRFDNFLKHIVICLYVKQFQEW